jgi:uncharacterized membrane protein
MRTPAALVALVIVTSAAFAEGPRFTQVPLTIRAMNADGNIAVGVGAIPGYTSASIRYNISEGTQEHIVATPDRPLSTHVSGISSDGSVFASNSGSSGFRTVLGVGSVIIERYPGASSTTVSAISGDGNVLTGRSDLYGNGVNIFPFRWTPQTGRQEIGPANGLLGGDVRDISRDGTTIVGSGGPLGGNGSLGWVWREGSGFSFLPTLPGFEGTVASAVSADGSIIVGTSRQVSNPAVRLVLRWIGNDLHAFPLPSGLVNPGIEDVSDDGNVMVGGVVIPGVAGSWGMICTPELGMLLASDYLAMHGLTLPQGVGIRRIYAVSADGMTFGGALSSGVGFVATVPAPASAALFAAAGLFAARRRRG